MSPTTATTPGYDLVDQRLKAAGIEIGASEVHGLLSGLLCSGSVDPSLLWTAELFDDVNGSSPAAEACQRLLHRMFERAAEEIEDTGAGFSLLLPADDRPLKPRALALVEWCQGFLYGVGLSGVADGRLSEETREALTDLSEITRMDPDDLEASEENEEAFMEISEFVRVAAMLVREHMLVGAGQNR